MKVLFVDDDNDLSQLFEFVASEKGIETLTFMDGLKALRYLDSDESDIDIVVLDLSLPILDGLTIAEQIRINEKIHPHREAVQIAFMTGSEINTSVNNVAQRVGVKKIYQKPYDLEALIEEIIEWRAE